MRRTGPAWPDRRSRLQAVGVLLLGGDKKRGERRWSSTPLTDRNSACDALFDARIYAGRADTARAVHAMRKYEELASARQEALKDDSLKR